MIDGTPRPDHGPGFYERICATCSASWVGHERDGDWCPWCEAEIERRRALDRSLLLDPPWLRSSVGTERYDALSDVDKAIWDRTRGQARGRDSLVSWAARLGRAVDTELISEDEAERALRRLTR